MSVSAPNVTSAVKIQGYGYRRDRLDPNDIIFNNANQVLPETALPQVVDLEDEMPPIYDQLDLGSCTANATGGIMQHCQMRQGEAEGSNVPSRLFIYYNERVHGGYPVDQDTGAEVRDGLWVLANLGAPPESDYPYDTSRFADRPSSQAYSDAKRYEAIQYKRIVIGGPGAPMRSALAQHFPIAFGFPVPAEFEDSSWQQSTHALRLPTASTQFIGGHAVVVIGYDWSFKRFPVPVFKVRNSWSDGWGENGHFYMDYRWFDPYRQLASDLWIVEKAS